MSDPTCGHSTDLSGDWPSYVVWCDLEPGHQGDHSATVEWRCVVPDCDQARMKGVGE